MSRRLVPAVVAVAALALVGFPGTADASKTETCFGQKADLVSTKDRDTVRLSEVNEVVVIKGNRTRAYVGSFDSDPGSGFTNRIAVCVKGKHARLSGFINRVHSSGKDTRLVFQGPCEASRHGQPRWFRVYQVDVKPCDPSDDFIGP